jgi:ERCC4-type nuclease
MRKSRKRNKKRKSQDVRKVDFGLSIDIREPQWIIDQLKERCDPEQLRIEMFEVGDYFYGGKIGIERKSATDFILSIPKVFHQVQELKRAFEIPYLLIEGDYSLLFGTRRKMSPKAIVGALCSIKAHYDVNVMFTNQQYLVDTILTLVEKHTDEKAVPYRPLRPQPSTSDYQINILTSLPYVGETTAKLILNEFGSPLNALTNIDRWSKIPRITALRLRKIREVLNEGDPEDTWEV